MKSMEGVEEKRMLGRSCKGFTLAELMVVICIASILSAIAVPSFANLIKDMEYRKAARDIVTVLRDGRSRSIMSNREHRIEYQPAQNRFRLTQGNRPQNSDSWNTVVYDWIVLSPSVSFSSNFTGNSTQINTNGTAQAGTIKIQDEATSEKYYVRVSSSGRIRTFKAEE